MSTTIIPDIYRHIARKSTVSRNVKPSSKNVSLCNPTFNIDNNFKEEQSIFDTIQCDIKLEKDIPQQEQSFIILPNNEIEQVIVEQTNEEIICDILEQIKYQIHEDFSNQIKTSNQRRTMSTDIHNVIDSLINHVDENDHEQSINTTNNESILTTNDVQMEDVTRSLNEDISMESNQQSSMLSRSQIDDDIVEIGALTSNTQSDLCTCQCHQTTSNSLLTNPTSEYLLFEQALRETRQEQQQEGSLNNNRLIQTLKRQHQELMNFYQRQLYINKIDREQQTIQINQHDSQIQTDLTTIQQQQQQQNFKPNVYQVNGTHFTPNSKGPIATAPRPFNSFLTPIRTTGPSLQQLIPCLTTTTTTLTNKTSMIKKTTSIATTNPHPPPLSSAPVSHDIVDLTEEEEENNTNRVSTQRTTPVKPQQSPASTSSSSSSSLTTATTTRIQPVNRPIRPNTTVPLGQTFPIRPLPEHIPCDYTIARPQLSITHDNISVRLTWNLPSTSMESIQTYEIYAYKQNATVTTSDWKKIGAVNSMRLPMAVTLKEFQSNCHYAFAVRAVSINNNIGPFCEPKTIFTGNTSIEPLNTSQTFDVST